MFSRTFGSRKKKKNTNEENLMTKEDESNDTIDNNELQQNGLRSATDVKRVDKKMIKKKNPKSRFSMLKRQQRIGTLEEDVEEKSIELV